MNTFLIAYICKLSTFLGHAEWSALGNLSKCKLCIVWAVMQCSFCTWLMWRTTGTSQPFQLSLKYFSHRILHTFFWAKAVDCSNTQKLREHILAQQKQGRPEVPQGTWVLSTKHLKTTAPQRGALGTLKWPAVALCNLPAWLDVNQTSACIKPLAHVARLSAHWHDQLCSAHICYL